MKTIIMYKILALLAICLPLTIVSQTVEEIVSKHIEAHGGLESWNKINALKITGNFTAFSTENDYLAFKTRDGEYYADFFLGEKNVIEASDGLSGWTIDPWQEIFYARSLNASEENVFLQKAEFFTPLYNYNKNGHTVEYMGIDTIDGFEVFELKLTRSNQHVETWYLSCDTYLEYACKSDWVDFTMDAPSEVYFDDFRSVDGFVLPFYVERMFWQRDHILIIEDVEINPEINKDMFVMPPREEMKDLEFMLGEWDVKVQTWSRRGTWFDLPQATSSIQYSSVNLLQENITYQRMFKISKVLNYSYNDNSKSYLLTVYNDLSTAHDFYKGKVSDTAITFINVDINTNTEETPSGLTKYTISETDEGGFVIETGRSADEGKTWNPGDKFIYTRKSK